MLKPQLRAVLKAAPGRKKDKLLIFKIYIEKVCKKYFFPLKIFLADFFN